MSKQRRLEYAEAFIANHGLAKKYDAFIANLFRGTFYADGESGRVVAGSSGAPSQQPQVDAVSPRGDEEPARESSGARGCEAFVWMHGGFHRVPCSRDGKREVGGEWLCEQHAKKAERLAALRRVEDGGT
jgi:hypothetical protein